MDRNTFTGLLIIAAILLAFTYFMRPSEADLKREQLLQDSLKRVAAGVAQQPAGDSMANAKVAEKTIDSALLSGPFGSAITGEEQLVTLENDVLKLTLNTKGGRIASVELKNEKRWDGDPLVLFEGPGNSFGLNLFVNNRNYSTNDLYFVPQPASGSDQAVMRLNYGPGQYIDFVYSLEGSNYLVNFDIRLQGMQQVIASDVDKLNLQWTADLLQQEKDMAAEQRYSTVYYNMEEDVDRLKENKDDEETLAGPVKWLSFKQHFFTSALIAESQFQGGKASVVTDVTKNNVIKTTSATLALPFTHQASETFNMQFYFGPSHFNTLKEVGYDLEDQVQLGWGPLQWINRWAVIPVFNWLDNFNLSYGIIILILTILLKLVLFPLTYTSYISQAKMRVLKPEMDEIKEKFKDEPTKVQQEYMKLYKSAGVNPLGGCLPMLLQMPILLAFFYFFPASFELRQESFLWVNDLATYDEFFKFGFTIPFVGSHLSLMCILMTASTIIYTYMNNQISGVTGQMKYIGYIMPIMFLGFLNSYPAGLNYYYLCANLITFSQQFMIRMFIDEGAIHNKLQENKKRPNANKKSKFQARLEEMMKQQQQQQKAKAGAKAKK
ncbi:protein translocase subunit yidC [Anseongella ginsenosidimutans]|uniref:Membrane protein insertase YidC n=1 Tax=Anseongella ginsenosidimutans TaxID=496056 RepID=A0A4R3KND2_9SPHI|nr:membrane protein insertase YidC [Anseongella ginsenosidimutans]QEC52746.1 membrane protein insertase YidC [Anseongella ginsenosidimutans]TCS85502.1 protein translocase subunit yidC [Anseongella ginsenosidimutans]